MMIQKRLEVIKGHSVRYQPVPYNNRRCRDFHAYGKKDLREIFGKSYKSGYDRDKVYSLAYVIMQKYRSLDCLSEPISLSERQKFSMEMITYLAQNLAVYRLVPQQFGHRSRNVLAHAFLLFTGRIQRYRSGHGLPFKTTYTLTKKELGYLIDFLDDNEYLWQLSDHWINRYHQRVKRGFTEAL